MYARNTIGALKLASLLYVRTRGVRVCTFFRCMHSFIIDMADGQGQRICICACILMQTFVACRTVPALTTSRVSKTLSGRERTQSARCWRRQCNCTGSVPVSVCLHLSEMTERQKLTVLPLSGAGAGSQMAQRTQNSNGGILQDCGFQMKKPREACGRVAGRPRTGRESAGGRAEGDALLED